MKFATWSVRQKLLDALFESLTKEERLEYLNRPAYGLRWSAR